MRSSCLILVAFAALALGCGDDDTSDPAETGGTGGTGGVGGGAGVGGTGGDLDAGDSEDSTVDGGSNEDGSTSDAAQDAALDASPDAQLYSLAIDPSSYDFEPVTVNTNVSQVFTIENDGEESITGLTVALDSTDQFSLEVADDCDQPMAPGASCTATVTYSPTDDADDADDATVLRATANEAEATAAISGETLAIAPGLDLDPVSIDFGKWVIPQESTPQTVTVTNSGAVDIADLTVQFSSGMHFQQIGDGCLGAVLEPGDSCGIDISFTPNDSGVLTDTLLVTYDEYSPTTVLLTGEGVESDLHTDNTLEFGPSQVGGSGHGRTLYVHNYGTNAIGPIDPASLTNLSSSNPFSLQQDDCSGVTLNPNDSCQIDLLFVPTDPGQQFAEITIQSGSDFAKTRLIGTTKDLWVDVNTGAQWNDGLTPTKPMDTISQALNESSAGWTLHVAPGTYGTLEEFPLQVLGQTLEGDPSDRPHIEAKGQQWSVVDIGSAGSFLSDFIIDAGNAIVASGRGNVVTIAVSSNGGSGDDVLLDNIDVLADDNWDGIDIHGGHPSTQVTVTNSYVSCSSSDSEAFAIRAQEDGTHYITDNVVATCADGVIAAGNVTMRLSGNDLSDCTRDSVRVQGSYSGTDMIDLGYYTSGNNNLAGTANTHVGIHVLTVPGNGVRLRNNIFKPNVQGADASGEYGAMTIPGPVTRTGGNNYAIADGASIQFFD